MIVRLIGLNRIRKHGFLHALTDPKGDINHADLNEVIASAMSKVVELHNAP